VDLRRARGAALALVALAACGAPPRDPAAVVSAYFAALGRDPMRSLPITTDAFHRAHGLGLVTTSQARAWRGGAEVHSVEHERVDRAQVAWLSIQGRGEFGRIARALSIHVGDVREAGDAAEVAVTVTPAQGRPFQQTFHLARADARAPWRIDAIEQSGVVPESAGAAFVAYPNEAARRAIERRVRPPVPPRAAR
jgi:hypothetical protein